jgi:PelA/Pel-15E family pectate lyase
LGELRFLARALVATGDERDRQAFFKGLDHVLVAQYANGGWPQHYPPGKSYARYITFNDGTMVGLMRFVREVADSPKYIFVDADRRRRATDSFQRGIQCIIRCQIVVDGRLTAWCAQHDEQDLRPRGGRTFELVSVSGAESVDIVRLLMSLDDPSPEVVRAIEGAVAWFQAARLTGIEVVERPDVNSPTGKNKVVLNNPAAPPLWARFYEIGTNRPIYSDRDGVARSELSQISYQRRNGYAWLVDSPAELLDRDYPAWKQKLAR